MDNKNIEIVIRDAEKDDCEAIAYLLAELGYPNTSQFAAKKIDISFKFHIICYDEIY